MIPLLALSGSLRAQSSNSRLLRVAQQLAPEVTKLDFDADLGALPHFNPDLDTENPPAAVAAFRARLDAAAGVVICTPEYAHSLPGTFKNALDWTVSSGNWMEKPALILKSSRSHFAHESLVEILTTIMVRIEVCELFLSGNGLSEADMLSDAKIAAALGAALAAFAAQIETTLKSAHLTVGDSR